MDIDYGMTVEVADLNVDRSYQPEIEEARFRRDFPEWRPTLVEPLIISVRDNGSLWIIDGQRRWLGAYKFEVRSVPATLYYGLTVAEEAMLFRALVQGSRRPRPYALFLARLASGDASALSVKRAVEARGFVLTESGSHTHGFRSFDSGVKIVETYGEAALSEVLGVLVEAYGHQHYTADSNLIKGLVVLLDSRQPFTVDRSHLARTLATRLPKMWWATAKAYTNDRGVQGLLGALVTDYNKAKRGGNRITYLDIEWPRGSHRIK